MAAWFLSTERIGYLFQTKWGFSFLDWLPKDLTNRGPFLCRFVIVKV